MSCKVSLSAMLSGNKYFRIHLYETESGNISGIDKIPCDEG